MKDSSTQLTSTLLNVGCGTHYAAGWLNTDYVFSDPITPDLVVDSSDPYPFDDNTFDAVYMGHVLEHIPWNDIPACLQTINRILKPGCPVMVVVPDVFKSLHEWKNNAMDFFLLTTVMEHTPPGYPEVRSSFEHHWNCNEERVFKVMSKVFDNCEMVSNRIPLDGATHFFDENTGVNWPINLWTAWQTAIIGYAAV